MNQPLKHICVKHQNCKVLGVICVNITIFWDVIMCNFVHRFQCLRETCCLDPQTVKLEPAHSSKIFGIIYQTAEDCNFNIHFSTFHSKD